MNKLSALGIIILLTLFTGNCFVYTMMQLRSGYHDFVTLFYKLGIVKTGQFTLRNGSTSDTYIDIRLCYGYPTVLAALANTIVNLPMEEYDYVCGVPYGAVPLATAIALQTNKPLLMARKELKKHGIGKMVEGVYQHGGRVLLVEDVTTSASSILETTKTLEEAGLTIAQIIALVDREVGGMRKLQDNGYNAYALFTLSQLKKHPFNQSKL